MYLLIHLHQILFFGHAHIVLLWILGYSFQVVLGELLLVWHVVLGAVVVEDLVWGVVIIRALSSSATGPEGEPTSCLEVRR